MLTYILNIIEILTPIFIVVLGWFLNNKLATKKDIDYITTKYDAMSNELLFNDKGMFRAEILAMYSRAASRGYKTADEDLLFCDMCDRYDKIINQLGVGNEKFEVTKEKWRQLETK